MSVVGKIYENGVYIRHIANKSIAKNSDPYTVKLFGMHTEMTTSRLQKFTNNFNEVLEKHSETVRELDTLDYEDTDYKEEAPIKIRVMIQEFIMVWIEEVNDPGIWHILINLIDKWVHHLFPEYVNVIADDAIPIMVANIHYDTYNIFITRMAETLGNNKINRLQKTH